MSCVPACPLGAPHSGRIGWQVVAGIVVLGLETAVGFPLYYLPVPRLSYPAPELHSKRFSSQLSPAPPDRRSAQSHKSNALPYHLYGSSSVPPGTFLENQKKTSA